MATSATPFVVSIPSSSSSAPGPSSSSQNPTPTNSIAITQLPKDFFHPSILSLLHTHFTLYGEINQWVPLSAFGRILVVYTDEEAAEHAKQSCDPILVHSGSTTTITLRVFRADPNPIIPRDFESFSAFSSSYIPAANYLRPPKLEKNFLISPPGSPPIGWEPIKEDPPNSAPLAEDLMLALQKLELQERERESGLGGLGVLLHPDDGDSGVGVYVEDCDGNDDSDHSEIDDDDWVYGETAPARNKWKPVTAMPPMRATALA